jgi:peroxiredoxin
MKKIILILLLIPFLSFAQEKADPKHIVKIGDIAPDFTLTYQDGKTQKLSDLRGKVIMLQFTASWCSVCLKEMPHIEKEIWQKYKNNKNFVLRGIDFKENLQTIKKFVKAAKVTYPILLDTSGAIFELYAEKDAGVTRNIIIDKNGKIVFLTRLFDQKEFDAMKEKIAELLAESK